MQFDFTKTLALIKGGLLDHQNTWKSYLEECPGWQQTALVLTLPLFLANALLSLILSRLVGGYAMYAYARNQFTTLISALVMGAIGFFIVVFVFNFLAGTFKGTPNFSRAFAAVSLVIVIVINMIIGLTLGLGRVGHEYRSTGQSTPDVSARKSASSGVIAEGVRQAEIIDAASSDQYDPPLVVRFSMDKWEHSTEFRNGERLENWYWLWNWSI